MTKLFHIKPYVKEMKIDDLIDSRSQENIIAAQHVDKFALDIFLSSNPISIWWVNKDAKIKVRKQFKIQFAISVNFIEEVELDVVPLDVCEVVFGIIYMYMWDTIFIQRDNQ